MSQSIILRLAKVSDNSLEYLQLQLLNASYQKTLVLELTYEQLGRLVAGIDTEARLR